MGGVNPSHTTGRVGGQGGWPGWVARVGGCLHPASAQPPERALHPKRFFGRKGFFSGVHPKVLTIRVSGCGTRTWWSPSASVDDTGVWVRGPGGVHPQVLMILVRYEDLVESIRECAASERSITDPNGNAEVAEAVGRLAGVVSATPDSMQRMLAGFKNDKGDVIAITPRKLGTLMCRWDPCEPISLIDA
eukprot:1189363-Prorocentrum_minimum.AAC.2